MAGQSVPESERATKERIADNLSSSSSTHNLPSVKEEGATAAPAGASAGEKRQWEEEKMKLYEQLDDKVGFSVISLVLTQLCGNIKTV